MKTFKYSFLFLMLANVLPLQNIYAQDIPTFIKYEEISTNSVEYTNEDGQPQAKYSTYVCGSGTIVRMESFINDDGVVSDYDLTTRSGDNNSWTVPLEINFNPDVEGVVEITLFQQRTIRPSGVFQSCETREWEPLLKYIIYRGVNPGGDFYNNSYYTFGQNLIKESNTNSNFIELYYEPTGDIAETIGSLTYQVENEAGEIVVDNTASESSGLYSVNYLAPEFGDYIFTSKLYDNSGAEISGGGPSKTVSVVPGCFLDEDITPQLTGNADIEYFEDGYQVESGETYTLSFPGIENLTDYYDITSNGGEDVLIDQNGDEFDITINSDLGSYQFEMEKREFLGEYCPTVPVVNIFTGGSNVTIEQPCPINLPEDLELAFGYQPENDPTGLVLEHFAATIKSNSQVIVKPGMTLTSGAELIIEYAPPGVSENDPDLDMNFTEKTAYNDYGQVIAHSRDYFDSRGQHLQSQSKVLSKGVILATQKIRDAYDRPVIQTLAAPILTDEMEVQEGGEDCGIILPTYFQYQDNFTTGYSADDFDLAQRNNPNAMDQSQAGTVGWYYSQNNGNSNNALVNEPLTASTDYPYARTLFAEDGSGEVISQTSPGDAYRAGGGHVPTQFKKEVDENDPILTEYLQIRENELGFQGQSYNEPKYYLMENTDADGKRSVSYSNYDEQKLVSVFYGNGTTPIQSSYAFYNDKGQMISNITPNGVKQYQQGVAFENIDKTTYEYNWKGFTTSITEKDGGRSEYLYAKDGRIRFSQNAQQRIEGTFSYTHYDESLRPIESGEFIPASADYAFESENLKALLDATGTAGNFPQSSGTKEYVNKSYYDKSMSDYPLSEGQQFVMGSVSSTAYFPTDSEEPLHSSYYSYDERGRLITLVQDIKGLGIKQIDYKYGPSGNVKEVAYQVGQDDEYYHYYEYDRDSRLSKVYSGTTQPEYNGQKEIVNKEDLILQATYDYYLHGPLKRTELIQANQGMDYLYTVNGNLKAINWADPTSDPGGDATDVFGMTLNYHPEDYSSAQMPNGTLGQSSFPDEAQYTGNIQAQEWNSPVDGYEKKAYTYSYDQRQQLKTANFGNTATGSFMDEGKYDVNINEYDENGNIKELTRTGETGNTIHELTYEYAPESNRLLQVKQADTVFRAYEYNAIGQMISQASGIDSMYIDYDVTGKMETVYANEAKTDTVMHIQYDDKGFRLSKTSFDSTYQVQFKTWYVRDASGTVMNIYVEALQTTEEPIVYETPVYGSGRLGAYRPSLETEGGEYYYEVKDHLGNVRVVIGGRDSVNYLATMEDERAAEEIEYFSGLKSTTVGSHLNHTPESEVANADRAVRINNVMDTETQPIGGAITLRVFPGDTLRSKVFAKYEDNSDGSTEVLATLASFLATAYGMPVGGEGVSNIFDVLDQSTTGIIGVKDDFDDSQPNIYLNYLLYDDDFNLVDFGIDPINTNAEIPDDPTAMTTHAFDELANEIIVEKPGFVYIYISNEDERNITAYFDDFEVKHTYGNIAVAKDQYPFGLAMEGRKLERKYWRYGYQGEYSEKDEETQWNAFQLRMFDPVIGRWTTTDPYGQFPSPYLGMGNNPVSGVDPDGGFCPTCTGGDDVYSVGATVTNVNGSWKYLGGGNWQDLTAQGTSGGFMGGFWDFMNYMDEFVPKGAGQGMINSPIQFVLSGENGQIDLNAAKMNPDAKTFVVDMDELDMINDVLTKHNPNSRVHKLTLTQQRNQGKSNPVYVMNRAATEQLAASKHALAHQVRTKLPESSLAKPRYKTITDTVWIEFNGVRDTFNIRTYEVQDF